MNCTNFAGWITAQLRPESCFINAATGQVFSDLVRHINAVSSHFLSQGMSIGSRVVVICKQDPETALAILGAIYAGLIPVPIEADDPVSITCLLLRAEAACLWSSDANHASLADSRIFIQGIPALLDGCEHPAVARQGSDLAVLMPTSGTTGKPRLVRVTHANLIANTLAIIQTQGLSSVDRAMLILPLSYCFGTSVLFSHLAVGGSVVFDRRFMFPDKVLQAIAKYACTTFAGVPSVYNILLRRSNFGKIPLPTLHRLLQAGGRLDPDRVNEVLCCLPNTDFYVMYGQTEATSRITSLPPENTMSHRGSVGKALPNLRIRIVDEYRKTLPPMAAGTIEVDGPSVCDGYWDDVQASRERFPDTWLQTGDRGWLDVEGFLWIEGRNNDFLKIRGRRVSFAEIEETVLRIAGVYEVAVLSIPDPEAGEIPAIFIVPTSTNDEDGLIEKIFKALPAAWTCRQVTVLPYFPLNTSGKLDRNMLKQMSDR